MGSKQLQAVGENEQSARDIIQWGMPESFRENVIEINGALLIAGLHQEELKETAEKLSAQLQKEIAERKLSEAALQEAKDLLTNQAGQLERLVAQRTEKLRDAVAELEAFSHSVAHDMRAPLRGMQGFARLLLEEHAGKLDPVAHSYLERIARSAVRMDALIQDVLNYTRVLRGEAGLAPVDLDRLLRDIITTYPDWQPSKADVQIIGTLPAVLGHQGFLTQCVSNLLGNAVRFVAPGLEPRVRIWAEDPSPPDPLPASFNGQKGAEEGAPGVPIVRIWFEDNGIGIAKEDHERIFRMFERVNSAADFEGTGVGLTIVRKAVERMGGRVEFHSEPGRGSKFWIELRKASPST